MREICQSGSEGGARFYSLLLPLSNASPSQGAYSYRQVLESGNLLPVSPTPSEGLPPATKVFGVHLEGLAQGAEFDTRMVKVPK